MTVSYVINGRDADARISLDTRQRVLDAADALGYKPNAVARMLATQRSECIAIVFQYASFFSTWSSFISDVMHGVSESAVQHGFDLMLHTRGAPTPDLEIGMVTDGRIDGVLLLRDGNDPLVNALLDQDFPMVLFFTRCYHPKAAFIDADNYAGGRIATQHLLDLGHRRIAMIRGSLQSVSSNDRFNGYRDALESAGVPIDPRLQFIAPTPDDELSGLCEVLRQPDRPTAIFVWSDDVAYKAMNIVRGANLRIPEDVSIVGFDSLEQSKLCNPALTSVNQPIAEMAKEAAELLFQIVAGDAPKRIQKVFPLSLDIRESTAPCPAEHASTETQKS